MAGRFFGDSFLAFSQHVGTVDSTLLEKAGKLLSKYLGETLQASFWEVMVDRGNRDRSNGEPVLETLWTSGRPTTVRIRNDDGEYTGQTTYAYDKRKDLWITAADRLLNEPSAEYNDAWNNSRDLPRYWDYESTALSKTSVIVVIKYDNRPLGFLNIEFAKYVRSSNRAHDETKQVADAIGFLLHGHALALGYDHAKQQALLGIERLFTRAPKSAMQLPKIFFAYSKRADMAVTSVVKDVIGNGFMDRLTLVDWQGLDASGNVSMQVVEGIAASDFGICYLSEPDDSQSTMFRDNPNVLFEAGLMHGLQRVVGDVFRSWLPLRERASSAVPFDIAQERTVIIPRLGANGLNDHELRVDLKRKLEDMLNRW